LKKPYLLWWWRIELETRARKGDMIFPRADIEVWDQNKGHRWHY
jgi:hypothetical protein